MFKAEKLSAQAQFIATFAVCSFVGLGLFAYGAWRNHGLDYSYLPWNLFLAWLPLIFAMRLAIVLRTKLWSSWEALAASCLWLLLLPNSFYMISDFIHLKEVRRVDLLFDAVMFTSFIYTGVALGFCSLYLVHAQLKRRFTASVSAVWVGIVIALCSAAVYIGRDLRWNSWDILTNPGGLLFDISDRLQHPAAYPHMLITVGSFFIVLSSMYALLWKGAALVRATR